MQMGFWRKFSLSFLWLAHLFIWKYLPFSPFQRQGKRMKGLLVSLVVLCNQGIWAGSSRKADWGITAGIKALWLYKNSGKDNRHIGKAIAPQLRHQAFKAEQETAWERKHNHQQPRINTVVFISIPTVLVGVLAFRIVLYYQNAFSRRQNRAIRIQDLLCE